MAGGEDVNENKCCAEVPFNFLVICIRALPGTVLRNATSGDIE